MFYSTQDTMYSNTWHKNLEGGTVWNIEPPCRQLLEIE